MGDGNLPVGFRGEAQCRGFGDEVSQKLKQFADTVYSRRSYQNLEISHDSPPES